MLINAMIRSGTYLSSGNQDGSISIWDIATSSPDDEKAIALSPLLQFTAHCDAVNGVRYKICTDKL